MTVLHPDVHVNKDAFMREYAQCRAHHDFMVHPNHEFCSKREQDCVTILDDMPTKRFYDNEASLNSIFCAYSELARSPVVNYSAGALSCQCCRSQRQAARMALQAMFCPQCESLR